MPRGSGSCGRSIRIGVGLAPVRGLPSVPASTLTDDFDDNSQDAGKWTTGNFHDGTAAVTGTVAETNQRVEVTPSTSSSGQNGYISVNSYDLTGDAVYVRITPSGTMPSGQQFWLTVGIDGNNTYQLFWDAGDIFFFKNVAGTFTSYGSFTWATVGSPNWFRLRHGGPSDDTLYLDTAPSSSANPPASGEWTNRLSHARDGIAINLLKSGFGTGSYASAGSTVPVYFDGFNTTTTNAIAGSTTLAFTPSATLLGTGAVSGSSALTFTNSATLLGSGAVVGSSTITLSPSATLLGGGPVVGSSTIVFSPSATLLGSGAVSGSSSLTFAPIATLLGTGQVVGSSSLTLSGSATLLGTGALLGTTALTFVGSATLTTAVSNAISGNANVMFVAGAVLTGIGQVSGATSFSLTVSGQLRASFVVMQPPAPVRITSPSPLSETNVIGPPHPSNVNVASSAVAAGTFTPAPKPSRVNWRT